MSIVSYRELRKLSAVSARQKVLELAQSQRPRQIAALLAMSRMTIYNILARYQQFGLDGLADRSRRPHSPAGQTEPATETIVVLERARTGFGPRRMKRHLQIKTGLALPESTLRNICCP